jgi:hypothetical protein
VRGFISLEHCVGALAGPDDARTTRVCAQTEGNWRVSPVARTLV